MEVSGRGAMSREREAAELLLGLGGEWSWGEWGQWSQRTGRGAERVGGWRPAGFPCDDARLPPLVRVEHLALAPHPQHPKSAPGARQRPISAQPPSPVRHPAAGRRTRRPARRSGVWPGEAAGAGRRRFRPGASILTQRSGGFSRPRLGARSRLSRAGCGSKIRRGAVCSSAPGVWCSLNSRGGHDRNSAAAVAAAAAGGGGGEGRV